MGIFGFLFGLGCLVVIAWTMAAPAAVLGIATLGGLVFGLKHRQQTDLNSRHRLRPQKFKSATRCLLLLYLLHQQSHAAE